jgi:catalase
MSRSNPGSKPPTKNKPPPDGGEGSKSTARSTASGPAPGVSEVSDTATAKHAGTEAVASAFPFNAAKPSEFGERARDPAVGQAVEPPHPLVSGSTLTEINASQKVGSGNPQTSFNPGNASLDRVRTDSGGRVLTTNQGVPIADNQNSLKAGFRGPALLEDFILREKITHFDHERIPERVVHARGSGAHGYFECYAPLTELTRASIFAEAGKRTPVFVRFPTAASGAQPADTARRVRIRCEFTDGELGSW